MEKIFRLCIVVLIFLFQRSSAVKCNQPGELIPNSENCHKYFKCSNGEPSLQDCPGTLIFDPILNICNWPDSTICIKDRIPKIRELSLESYSKVKESDLELLSEIVFSDNVPTVPTAPPRRRTTKRISERVLNLFNSRNRKFNKIKLRNPKPRKEDTSRQITTYQPRVLRDKEHTKLLLNTVQTTTYPTSSDDTLLIILPNLNDLRKTSTSRTGLHTESDQNFGKNLSPPGSILPYSTIERDFNNSKEDKYLKSDKFRIPELYDNPSNIKLPIKLDEKDQLRGTTERTEILNYIDIGKSYKKKSYSSENPLLRESEISAKEEFLIEEYPMLQKIKETVKTLDALEVENIEPGNLSNPGNVQRVEFILPEGNYDELFPQRHFSYSYKRLLQAIGKYPSICSLNGEEEKSEKICRKTLATMFAHFVQDTKHARKDTKYAEWRQGLNLIREQNCTDTSSGCGYNRNCGDEDSLNKKWSCGKNRRGKWMKYYGRGAINLKHSHRYGQFSQAMFGDGRLLLDYPDFVADTWLNFASAAWLYATPQPLTPSLLQVIEGTWLPNDEDTYNGLTSGFGMTINIISGGKECGSREETLQAKNRISYYKQFAWYLYVDYQEEELGCAGQGEFSAEGAGAVPFYWDMDSLSPYSCKLVMYQTAHSALVKGEYLHCVEEHFKVKISRKYLQILKDFVY